MFIHMIHSIEILRHPRLRKCTIGKILTEKEFTFMNENILYSHWFLTWICYTKLACTFVIVKSLSHIKGVLQYCKCTVNKGNWAAKEGQWVSGYGLERRLSGPTLDASRYETLGECIRTCRQCGSVCSHGSEGCISGTRTRWKSPQPGTETGKGSTVYNFESK